MNEERADQILGVARFLADHDPVASARLLGEHVPDASGHCGACRTACGRGSPVWPCTLRVIGEEAQRITKMARKAPRSSGRRGNRDPSWRTAFAATPHHVFVPSYWDTDVDGRPGEMIDGSGSGQRSAWLAAVCRDRSLTTGWATVPMGDAVLRVVSAAARGA